MADISPFSGLRYATERVGDLASVLCPPYDVISEDERRELEELVRRVEHCRQETHPRFFDFFVDGCQFTVI